MTVTTRHGMRYFNPLPPHGGRQNFFICFHLRLHFNPLPPHGGRRAEQQQSDHVWGISIHSLRMEGDLSLSDNISLLDDFNPLPPHGGRRNSAETA